MLVAQHLPTSYIPFWAWWSKSAAKWNMHLVGNTTNNRSCLLIEFNCYPWHVLGTRPKAVTENFPLWHMQTSSLEEKTPKVIPYWEHWLRDELDTAALLTGAFQKIMSLKHIHRLGACKLYSQPTDITIGVEHPSRQHSCDNFQLHTARCLHSIEGQCSMRMKTRTHHTKHIEMVCHEAPRKSKSNSTLIFWSACTTWRWSNAKIMPSVIKQSC